MNIEHLITMANQIGTFYHSYPDVEQAKIDIAKHIKNFWDPRMRQQLIAHAIEKQGLGLEPIVVSTIKEHTLLLS